MSADRLKQIVIGLVALIFLWGAVEILRGGFDEATTDFELPAVAADDADTVMFVRAADTVILAKVDGDWRVNGYRASAGGVTDFFGVLADAPAGQLVAQNAGTHARLEIEDGVARGLRVLGGGETLLNVLLGKRAPGFQDSYFRHPGEDNVYSESLDATGFYGAGEDSVPTFIGPDRRTVLRSADGDTLLELAFDSTAAGYWVRKTGDSTVYQISNFVVDRLAPRDSVVRGR
jgi:hypothetical protein